MDEYLPGDFENNWLKNIAKEFILLGLRDLKAKNNRGSESMKNFESAKKWFEEKGRQVFGYYWCLNYSGMNPNALRKLLNEHGVKYGR